MNATTTRQLAVITGASSGIGYELAKVFADHGFDLLINAEDDRLQEAQRTLATNGTTVEAAQADLSEPKGVEKLYKRIQKTGRPVDALALNAGIGEGGDFVRQTDLEQELRLVDLNVRSTVHLSKLVLGDMVRRGEGRVLFTSSIASTMPGTYQAVYNGSKSFVQSFALAIRRELKGTGVSVTSLMPGPTDTDFFRRAHMEDTRVGSSEQKDDPSEVARQGFEALMQGRERVVSGSLVNRLLAYGGRLVPDKAKAEAHRLMAEPGSADKGHDQEEVRSK
jgi:short-subunit dehydrogenase